MYLETFDCKKSKCSCLFMHLHKVPLQWLDGVPPVENVVAKAKEGWMDAAGADRIKEHHLFTENIQPATKKAASVRLQSVCRQLMTKNNDMILSKNKVDVCLMACVTPFSVS